MDSARIQGAGIRTAAYRDDTYEPFEYQEYWAAGNISQVRGILDSELVKVGFATKEEVIEPIGLGRLPRNPSWIRGDVEITLYAEAKPPSGSSENHTVIFVRRYIGYGLVTQFRVWLFDERKE